MKKNKTGPVADEDKGDASRSANPAGLKEIATHFLQTPDNQIGWFFPAVYAIFRLSKPDILYSTAPPFTSHLVAVIFKKIWRIPLVCDFRDPWLDNPFRQPRPKLLEGWERRLENLVFLNADLIIANTPAMAQIFRTKYPEVASRVRVITNGYDPEDFKNILPSRTVPDQKYLLLHAGSLYGKRDPSNFLKGVKNAVEKSGCTEVIVQLIGPCQDFEGTSLEQYIHKLGLEKYVESIDTVSHQHALSRMKGADTVLLFAQGTNLQVPAKIYEYMGLKKPVFAVLELDSATAHTMKSLGPVHVSTIDDDEEIAVKLVDLYNQWKSKEGNNNSVPIDTSQFYRRKLTDQLEKSMLSVLNEYKN